MKLRLQSHLSIGALAQIAGVSMSQVERDFLGLFGVSPLKYQTRLKIQASLDLLEHMPITHVALACGYSDQSAFSRQFRTVVGSSPAQYRRSLVRPQA